MNNRVSWLNLHKIIPWRQVRAMVYARLCKYDYMLCRKAHNPKSRVKLTLGFSKYCAKYNYIHLLHWSHRIGMRWNNECENIAAFNGSTDVVQWILKRNRVDYDNLARFAACGGMIHLFYIIKPLDVIQVMQGAIEGDQLQALKWVDKSHYILANIFMVIRRSYMPIVMLLDPYLKWELAWSTLLVDGSLELLHWAHGRGAFDSIERNDILTLTIATGKAERVEFALNELKTPWTEEAIEMCLATENEGLIHLLEIMR